MAQKIRNKKKAADAEKNTLIVCGIVAFAVVVILIASIFAFGKGGGKDSGTSNAGESGDMSANAEGTSGGDAATDPETEDLPVISGADAPATDAESMGNETEDASNEVTVSVERTSDKSGTSEVVMLYPLIKSDGGRGYDMASINSLITEYMNGHRDSMCAGVEGEEYEYIIENTNLTYVSDTFFSAVVSGHFYAGDDAHPTVFAYGINCDLAGGRLLEPSDMILDFEKVRSAFTGGKFKLTYGEDGLMDETNYEDMITRYMPDYDIYPEVYYTKDGFGMSIELVYTLGGYALFEIPLSALGSAVYVPGK